MAKLVISETRYDAVLYASHLLDERSTIITISDGFEERNTLSLCRSALEEQRKFEVEKAYKVFGVRQLYCFNQNLDKLDYQFVLLKLQLMMTVMPFTHICYLEGNKNLVSIYDGIIGDRSRIGYLKEKTDKALVYKLNDAELERKLSAIERMVTIRTELLYNNKFDEEYLRRVV